jgi:GNAT superfamily N-acetyltransferase
VLYKDDEHWVPPLLSMRRQLLDKAKHPAWKYMEGEFFGAWRGDELVGTIVGFINHAHNDYHNENIGFFGMFETINDREVAEGLLDVATEWVRAQGVDAIRGPANLTTNEECGLLIKNFTVPMVMMPYNPPYYQELIESTDFEKVMDLHSMYFDRPLIEEHGALERLEKIVNRATKRSNIIIRNFNMKKKKEEFLKFRDIYNDAWEANWGFFPMNEEELDALVADLGMLVEPELAFFAEIDGEPVGFALSIPNFNEALAKAYPRPGVPELWTLAQVGWHWKVRKIIKGARMPLMGVKKEHRNKGVDLAFFLAVMKAMLPSQYEYLDSGWILETNQLVSISVSLGNEIYKTHRMYEKPLKA